MNKSKAISLLLISSFMLSSTSCTMGEKKKVLEVVDNYAQAITDADLDAIQDLLKSDNKYEDIVCTYVNNYQDNEDFSDVYEFILDNMTYEIDQDSIVVSKESNTASVNIIYTLIDYMSVMEDLDEGAEPDDYLDELEDNTDNVIHIRQKIELKLVKENWKITDSDYENILEVYEFYEEIFKSGFFRISFVQLTPSEFENCLDEFGIDEDNIFINLDSTGYVALVYTDYTSMTYFNFSNDASFDAYVDSIREILDGNDPFSSYRNVSPESYIDDDTGYVCLLESNSTRISEITYISGNSVLSFSSMNNDSELIEFLDFIGYPHP